MIFFSCFQFCLYNNTSSCIRLSPQDEASVCWVALLFLQFEPGRSSPTGESSDLKVLCSKFPVYLSLLNFNYNNWWLRLLILYFLLFHILPGRRGSWLSQLVHTIVHPTPVSTRVQETMQKWMKDFLLVCAREGENIEHYLGDFEVPVKTSTMGAISLEHPNSWRQSPPDFHLIP